MGCKYHPEVDVVCSCEACKLFVCEACVAKLEDRTYCHQCYWDASNVRIDAPISWITRSQIEWSIGLFCGIAIQIDVLLLIDRLAALSTNGFIFFQWYLD